MSTHVAEILSHWYRSQKYMVKWGKAISSSLTAFNGISQGGLIFVALYNVYTDELYDLLPEANVTSHIAGQCLNHFITLMI